MMHAVKVSVIIKTLNEEANVERAVESSLEAVAPFDGEVILADSGSTDRTVEKASKFPVTIVQLGRPQERRCGIGPQLGYQHSNGEYVYILDGDMKLDAAFLAHAIEFLDREPLAAGVGGSIHEMRIDNLEFQARLRRRNQQLAKQVVDVTALNGGGLYRRAAVEQVGYFSDRNLHGYEEYDLGVRLRTRGWRLVRLEHRAVDHYGYQLNTWRLLRHRIRGGYMLGAGEILRAAIHARYLKNVFGELRALPIAIGVWIYWALVVFALSWLPSMASALSFFLIALLLPMAGMAQRTRSLRLGAFSVLFWHVNAIGLVVGLLRKRTAPTERIESRTLRTADN